MHSILAEIIEKKKKDLNAGNKSYFLSAISKAYGMAIIGELKIASPQNPRIGSKKDLVRKAREYKEGGVSAISIITEKHFFKGDNLYIPKIKRKVVLPILQKDFVIDIGQIYEAKGLGADAILFIARIVDGETLKKFVLKAKEIGIEPVVEIVNKDDLERAIQTKTDFIAVNARDLDTFQVSVENACKLMKEIPEKFIRLGFSGIYSAKEIEQYKEAGARGVLVGTSLMKAKNIKKFINELRGFNR